MHFRLKPQTPNAKIETPNRIQRYRIGNPKLRNQIGNLSQLTYKIPEAAVVSSDSASMEKHAARSRSSSSKHQNAYVAKNIISQDLFTPDYILNRIFRKDGPPLGVKFDSLPSGKLFHCKGKVVPKKDIAEITKRFNIQVSNLTHRTS
ncbi:uncharacterized protein LOC133820979 isoform X3 [Humulus lupulus]|uniref:uncharacterized protein LOC133820979 isoform X3 n=1 Tax=Humulus lupulus TaxID=3486 RepID=UPI002B4162A7|nr:uncharacterized protein LOC133820979 isoform X3 [Humulus lupulus]